MKSHPPGRSVTSSDGGRERGNRGIFLINQRTLGMEDITRCRYRVLSATDCSNLDECSYTT